MHGWGGVFTALGCCHLMSPKMPCLEGEDQHRPHVNPQLIHRVAAWKLEWELLVSWRMLLKWKHPVGYQFTNSKPEQPKILPGSGAGGFWCSAGARSPLCSPSHCQLGRFCCLKAWEEIFQGNVEQGQCLPQTTPICDIVWDKVSASSPRGDTNRSLRIEWHLEASHGCHALGKQH